MKLVIQRVTRASVTVENQVVGRVDKGFLVLVGLEKGDGAAQVKRAAAKVAGLRVFEDDAGKMNLDLEAVGGAVLAVSQFTIAGSIRKGRRPSFDGAMHPDQAAPLFDSFVEHLRGHGLEVATGVFGAKMQVELVNDGPVTLIWDDPTSEG